MGWNCEDRGSNRNWNYVEILVLRVKFPFEVYVPHIQIVSQILILLRGIKSSKVKLTLQASE